MHGLSDLLTWALAVIAGGGAAGAVQLATTAVRGASSVTTAGFGNPLLSTLEAGGAAGVSVLAVAVPLVAAVLVLTLLLVLIGRSARRGGRRPRGGSLPPAAP